MRVNAETAAAPIVPDEAHLKVKGCVSFGETMKFKVGDRVEMTDDAKREWNRFRTHTGVVTDAVVLCQGKYIYVQRDGVKAKPQLWGSGHWRLIAPAKSAIELYEK